jgi:GAF domain-containing protein
VSEANAAAEELATVFARMSGLLLSQETMSNALRLVTSLARETLPNALGAGVTLLDGSGKRITAQATDPLVERIDALQYELNEGPCLTAWSVGTIVRIDDLAVEQRWPNWVERARPLGMAATLSAPLIADAEAIGALKVYAGQPGVFAERDEKVLAMFADQAAIVVANMHAYESARRLSENLQATLETRDTIALAKGILMGRDGADEGTALTTLAGLAAQRQSTLYEAASATVRTAVRRPGL